MFEQLVDINARPQPFESYTAKELWTDEHTSEQMLMYHLNDNMMPLSVHEARNLP